jgi:hypothetical protein
MSTTHVHLDLGEAGHIEQYVLERSAGAIAYEFPDATPEIQRLGVVLVTLPRASGNRERRSPSIRVQRNGWDIPDSRIQFASGSSRGVQGYVAVFDASESGFSATVDIGDEQAAEAHIALLPKLGFALRTRLESALGKFSGRCWSCKKLVRFLISLLLTGGIDEDAALEVVLEQLPEDLAAWLRESDLLEMLGKIYGLLKRFDPRQVVAEEACRLLGFCPSATPTTEPTPTSPHTSRLNYRVRIQGPWPAAKKFIAALQATPGIAGAIFAPVVVSRAPHRPDYGINITATVPLTESTVRLLAEQAGTEILSFGPFQF